ncbi:hypothetical protein E2562_005805 [Oryza meyeriana var. granulata]|uniref:Uncharacterized protein n=1 Tax=Oryza meyeriana var. granulata TaxID=110450 RepID=A0A6G1F4U7_9ORYZ|nr:hypothetical protein E2562_005805 [Oryza meyeriana var. granulata]
MQDLGLKVNADKSGMDVDGLEFSGDNTDPNLGAGGGPVLNNDGENKEKVITQVKKDDSATRKKRSTFKRCLREQGATKGEQKVSPSGSHKRAAEGFNGEG